MRAWVTRAEPGASATAARLGALGWTPLVAPLLEVRPLPVRPEPSDVALLAFTSANAARAFAAAYPAAVGRTPVAAVGRATADAARAAGFAQVAVADGDVDALARLIATLRPEGLVLHAAGRQRAGDLQGALSAAGLKTETLALYETCAAASLAPEAAAAIEAGELSAVLLHSPRAAEALRAILERDDAPAVDSVRAVGLSPACLQPLKALRLASLEAACQPTDEVLLARLGPVPS